MATKFLRSVRTVVFAFAVTALLLSVYGGCRVARELYLTHGAGYVVAGDLLFDDAGDVGARKAAFFAFMRPVIEAENRRIANLRRRILAVRKTNLASTWVASLAAEYGLEWPGGDQTNNNWAELLKRVDVTPLALALVQSANESNWGQSRFARQGNNMFGQWCFSTGCGMVPKRRTAGKRHEVAAFDTVNASVRAYLKNINSGKAYGVLRDLRQGARRRGERPRADVLATGLLRYSERGAAYVNDIRAMIRVNRALIMAP